MCHGPFHACASHLLDKVVSYTISRKEQDSFQVSCFKEGWKSPCKLIFRGTLDELQKVTKYYRNALGNNVCICKTNGDSTVTAVHTVRKSVATIDDDYSSCDLIS